MNSYARTAAEPTSGRIVIGANGGPAPSVIEYSTSHTANSPRWVAPKQEDPLLRGFLLFCGAGIVLQLAMMLLGSIRFGLEQVLAGAGSLGALVFSPAGLALLLIVLYAVMFPGHRRRAA